MSDPNAIAAADVAAPAQEVPEVVPPVEGEAKSEGDKPEKQPLTDEQRRIRSLERKLDKAHKNNARLFAEAEQFKRAKPEPPKEGEADDEPKFTKAEVEEYLAKRREAERESEVVTSSVKRTIKEGQKAYSDFDQKTNELVETLELLDAKSQPTPLLRAILDGDQAHEVIYHLATNPDLAEEIAELSPAQQIRRLARLEVEIETKPKTSAAAKPLTPVKPKASDAMPDPSRDLEGWIAKRNATARY